MVWLELWVLRCALLIPLTEGMQVSLTMRSMWSCMCAQSWDSAYLCMLMRLAVLAYVQSSCGTNIPKSLLLRIDYLFPRVVSFFCHH